MVEDKSPRIRSKLDKDADKTAQQISDNVYEKSIEINLKQTGRINREHLEQFRAYLLTKGDKVRSIETKIKIIRYLQDTMSDMKREVNQLRHHLKKIQVIEGKDLKKTTRKDIEHFFATKPHIKPRTKEGYKIHIKNFFQWIYNLDGTKEYPEVVSWIKTKNIKKEIIEEYELISKSDIKKLCENCIYLRDKVMILVLYDGALRISELCNLKIKDVVWDEYGCKINIIAGKTGSRKIRLVESVPILKQWLNQHPFKDNLEKNLFVCLGSCYGKPMVAQGAYKMIAKTQKRAGIQNRVHPHAFRHTKIMELAKSGYNESELRLWSGWARSSTMPEVYLHYSEKDLDDKILTKNNLRKNEERIKILREMEENNKKLQPQACIQCGTTNDSGNRFCSKCGFMLNRKEATKNLRTNETILDMARLEQEKGNQQIIESMVQAVMKKISEKREQEFKVKSISPKINN